MNERLQLMDQQGIEEGTKLRRYLQLWEFFIASSNGH